MENYFNMNLEKQDIDAISNLGLAHMGDCVFEILCRGYLCARGGKNVGNLHRDTINLVKAQSQAQFVDKLLPLLTERNWPTTAGARMPTSTQCPNPALPRNMPRPPAWKPCLAPCIWRERQNG